MLDKRKVLFYVIKYEGKYYSPYLSYKSYTESGLMFNINNMLTPDIKLAIRIGDEELAKWLADFDTSCRITRDKNFDPSKVKIVKIYGKK
jgi:hypothetical protein